MFVHDGSRKEDTFLNKKEMEDRIIQKYQQDEAMMVLLFAQWCVNHELDPAEVYSQAYPEQGANPLLEEAMELTVPKEESQEIADETLIDVMSLYENTELIFVVTEEIRKRAKPKQSE